MKVGITGGIGSGKSFICKMLKGKGYQVYNCDDRAKELMVKDSTIIERLKQLIGEDAYLEDTDAKGNMKYLLNKKVIASFLFANPHNAEKVNSIVHPIVKEDFCRWAEQQNAQTVFMECAILFESGFDDSVDKTVLIYADEEMRVLRAMSRDKCSEEQIRSRMSHQISGEEARMKADYILDHNEYHTTEDEVEKMLLWINSQISQ